MIWIGFVAAALSLGGAPDGNAGAGPRTAGALTRPANGLVVAGGRVGPEAARRSARTVDGSPALPDAPDLSSLSAVLVVDVLDGRSIVLQGEKGQEIVSLLGVEPLAEAGGRGAGDALRDLALGERVYALDHEGGARSDSTGRRSCYVYRAPEGTLLNLELIRQGYASASADFAYQHLEVFKAWAGAAKKAGRGLHAAPAAPDAPASDAGAGTPIAGGAATPSAPVSAGEVKPAGIAPASAGGATLVYVTRSGTKYHTQACRFAKSASPMSLADAKAKHLEPCTQCSPGK